MATRRVTTDGGVIIVVYTGILKKKKEYYRKKKKNCHQENTSALNGNALVVNATRLVRIRNERRARKGLGRGGQGPARAFKRLTEEEKRLSGRRWRSTNNIIGE